MALSASGIDALTKTLFEKIKAYSPEIKLDRLKQAYDFAKNAHQGQLRHSGEPYIMHPVRTVEILTRFRVDEDTLMAAFLHDVPEDTGVAINEIEKNFGAAVAYLVDGVTKLSKVHYKHEMERRQIESLKKLFIHSAEDLRAILIKLSDRLDNMRTLRFIANEEKRMRIARETLEIYVPIANLLGIGELRAELEDLSFEHLHPVDYENVKRQTEKALEERTFILDEMIRITKKELAKMNIEAEVAGRQKSLYSVFRKLQAKQNIQSIDDLIAIRAIVPTRKDCYELLGIIHRLFKPKPGCIKDYIAVPKSNGYQSIHTAVYGTGSSMVEFQIRTRYMHLEAEYGVAAHYFYKYADEQELANIMSQRSGWVARILELQKDQKDPRNFIEHLKLDVFQDRIFVFSPKGDVIDLPAGASAIDFAYAIHTDIGNHAQKTEINNIISPVTAQLKNGDIVHMITHKDARPEREWLAHTKTTLADHKIKEYLHRLPIENKIMLGKKILQKEFDRAGKNYFEELSPKRLKSLPDNLQFQSMDELLALIGEGAIQPQQILEKTARKKEFISRVGLRITGDNGKNQFREIMRTINALHIPIVKFIADRPWYMDADRCRVSVLIKNYSELRELFESIEHLEGVAKIRRTFAERKMRFIAGIAFTALIWLTHPFMVNIVLVRFSAAQAISNLILYSGLIMLAGLVLYLNRLSKRSFPEMAEMTYFWPASFLVTTLAFFTVAGEILTFDLKYNWVIAILFITGIYALLLHNYLKFKRDI